jgi:hypothetical protein
MISKCQNIVINRTKFSDFEPFQPEMGSSTEGLKLVGFIESTDLCTGEKILKNVSVDYPNINPVSQRASNLIIDNLHQVSALAVKPVPCNDGNITLTRYTVTRDFEGDLIQINNLNDEYIADYIFSEGYLNVAFTKEIPFGRTIQIIFNNFDGTKNGIKLRQVSYDENNNHTIAAGPATTLVTPGDIPNNNASILITFIQTTDKGTAAVSAGSSILHKVAASEIQILN